MIKSMTAFARTQDQGEWGSASIELKAVNHRYLDINFRLPEMLRELEMPLRELIRKNVQRGKVDCTIRYTVGTGVDTAVNVNQDLLDELIETANSVATKISQTTPYTALDILKWPGVMQVAENDMTAAHKAILALANKALDAFNEVRAREGAALEACILQRVDDIYVQVEKIEPRTQEIVAEQRKKLIEKVTDLDITLDEGRVEQEVAIVAQRLDIAEELDRLKTHLKEVKHVLKKGGPVGRRLDFIMQELNREANTTASKSIDTEMTQAAVEMKVLIEQMREQVQNLE